MNIVQKEKLETDLAFMFNFFDTVVYCAAKNICDPDIILDLFYPSARELYVPFYQYIQTQQNSFNEFGVGVETQVRLRTDGAKANRRQRCREIAEPCGCQDRTDSRIASAPADG